MVGHAVKLQGADLPGIADPQGRPTMVSIIEQDFIPWFLDRLGTETGRAELAGRNAFAKRNEAQEPRLYQPVHRAFNVVAVEVFCDIEGLPRLDPKKILKAGVIVRRRTANRAYGWVSAGGRILGWRSLDGEPAWDPEPDARREAALGKNRAVLSRSMGLAGEKADWQEAFAPLYPAPPEICKALGKTLLFGYLPLTSSERSEDDPAPEAPFTDELIRARMPLFLWRAARRNAEIRDNDDVTAPLADAKVAPEEAGDPSDALATVMAGVTYLAQEPGLFTPPLEPENDAAADLREALQAVRIEVKGDREDRPGPTRNLYTVLSQAYDLLIRRANDDGTAPGETDPPLRLPVDWPDFTRAQETAFVNAIKTAVAARWAVLSPGETRFQDLSARYEISAFARIDRSDCGCPPETIWTPPTEAVEIVPWYESGDAPPTVVELPDPTADFLGKLKPNVAFKVPEGIQKFMAGMKLTDIAEGKKPDEKLGWGMICGFSIPIITICAFIVLQIFLVLFHILFWWLPFIRICIPFPKTGGNG